MTDLATTITAVTVYADKARITREGRIRLAAGANTIAVRGIPTTIDASSVRVKGRGAGARIAGSEVATAYLTQPASGNAVALQTELDGLRDTDTTVIDEVAGVADRLEMLKSLRDATGPRFAKSIASGKASVDNVRPMAQYLSDEYAAAMTQKRALNARRRDLARDIKAVENRLRQAQSTNNVETREIRIDVDAAADTDAEFEITYAVDRASWTPVYDARLTGSKLSLTYFAQVRQSTGEDWPACALSLSTAETGTGGTIPELEPWYIAKYEPEPRREKRAMPRMAMQADADMGSGMLMSVAMPQPAAMAAPMEEYSAAVESSGIAVTYRSLRPLAVPSDNTQRKTLIGEIGFDAALDYVSVPKLGPDVFLRAKVKNMSELVFLPGYANVFHDDELVGSTEFDEPITRNREFELQLGVDNRIQVERELTQRDTGKTFIGNTRRLTFAYRTKVTNTRDTAIRVTLHDQLPVSRHEDIKIKLADATPKPVEQTDLNLLKWEIDVPAGATREAAFSYTVEHPRDMQVVGLE